MFIEPQTILTRNPENGALLSIHNLTFLTFHSLINDTYEMILYDRPFFSREIIFYKITLGTNYEVTRIHKYIKTIPSQSSSVTIFYSKNFNEILTCVNLYAGKFCIYKITDEASAEITNEQLVFRKGRAFYSLKILGETSSFLIMLHDNSLSVLHRPQLLPAFTVENFKSAIQGHMHSWKIINETKIYILSADDYNYHVAIFCLEQKDWLIKQKLPIKRRFGEVYVKIGTENNRDDTFITLLSNGQVLAREANSALMLYECNGMKLRSVSLGWYNAFRNARLLPNGYLLLEETSSPDHTVHSNLKIFDLSQAKPTCIYIISLYDEKNINGSLVKEYREFKGFFENNFLVFSKAFKQFYRYELPQMPIIYHDPPDEYSLYLQKANEIIKNIIQTSAIASYALAEIKSALDGLSSIDNTTKSKLSVFLEQKIKFFINFLKLIFCLVWLDKGYYLDVAEMPESIAKNYATSLALEALMPEQQLLSVYFDQFSYDILDEDQYQIWRKRLNKNDLKYFSTFIFQKRWPILFIKMFELASYYLMPSKLKSSVKNAKEKPLRLLKYQHISIPQTSKLNLRDVPIELLLYIADFLKLHDIFHLYQTCQKLRDTLLPYFNTTVAQSLAKLSINIAETPPADNTLLNKINRLISLTPNHKAVISHYDFSVLLSLLREGRLSAGEATAYILVNASPNLITIFMKWLTRTYQIEQGRSFKAKLGSAPHVYTESSTDSTLTYLM